MLCEHGNTSPCVECDIEPLRAENESLRARVAELEDGLRVITQYPDVREYVGTICHDVALSALKGSDGAWLLRTQADALERQSVDVVADHDN